MKLAQGDEAKRRGRVAHPHQRARRVVCQQGRVERGAHPRSSVEAQKSCADVIIPLDELPPHHIDRRVL